MQITELFEGLFAPLYALVGGSFDPSVHFGQLILCVLSVIAMLSVVISLFKH